MNKLKCGNCKNYDVLKKATPSGLKETRSGRCMKRTLYPYKDPDGHKYPPEVERVEEGTNPLPSQVKIVHALQVVTECIYAEKK